MRFISVVIVGSTFVLAIIGFFFVYTQYSKINQFVEISEKAKSIQNDTKNETADSSPASGEQSEKPKVAWGTIVKKTGDNSFSVSMSNFPKPDEADLTSILSEARVIPQVKEGGGVDGFKFVSIKPNGLFDHLGFKTSDIIKSVNGSQINSPAAAMNLYSELQGKTEFKIQIERDQKNFDLNVNLTE